MCLCIKQYTTTSTRTPFPHFDQTSSGSSGRHFHDVLISFHLCLFYYVTILNGLSWLIILYYLRNMCMRVRGPGSNGYNKVICRGSHHDADYGRLDIGRRCVSKWDQKVLHCIHITTYKGWTEQKIGWTEWMVGRQEVERVRWRCMVSNESRRM